MNQSGTAVAQFVRKKGIKPEHILVLHDELDFSPGTLRLKYGGGTGGHNGLLSINEHLGSQNYWRLRVGIGRPANKEAVRNYVLGRPSPQERSVYEDLVPVVNQCLQDCVCGDMQSVVQKLHSNN